MHPHFSEATLTSLFPYSSGYSVDEQNRCIAFELPEYASSMAMRNEKLAWVVEHYIAIPAREQLHGTNVLSIEDQFKVFSSNPSLLAFKLDLFQLVCNVLHQRLCLVGTQAPPMTDVLMGRWAVCGKESSKKRLPRLSPTRFVPSSYPLIRPDECDFRSLARPKAEVSLFGCRVQEVPPA